MRLADDQDRQRIARALDKAADHGNHEASRDLGHLKCFKPRKKTLERRTRCTAEMREIGAEGGISVKKPNVKPEASDS